MESGSSKLGFVTIFFTNHYGWFPRFESNKYFAIKVNQTFSIRPFGHPQGPQGYQNIHQNILQMNLMSYYLKIKSKVTIFQKNLKNVQKLAVFLVYTLIRAKLLFDIDITNAHNPSDQETVKFLSRNYQV